MSPIEKNHSIGGFFLIEPIGTYPIYTREQFSDEHNEIEQMVREFAQGRIHEEKEEIDRDKAYHRAY